MISRFFIDRPIMASVLAIVITLAGVVALLNLPVAQYPDIMPPQITVEAAYPGATAEVVSNNVAAPIELQVNGADNMMYMFSTSSNTGNMTLNVLFKVGTNVELAQVDVQNRVNIALPQLPQAVVDQGIKVQRRSNAFMILVAVYSPDERYDTIYVANYASLYVLDELKRVPGASQATIFGATDYAMRIWLKPDRMAELGISAAQVADAIRKQNQQFAVGQLGQPPTKERVEQTLTVTTRGRLLDPREFENIILRAAGDGAAIVRLKDVGRAELGARDYSLRRRLNGKPATFIAVYQQPGANALDVSKEIRKTLVELKKSFPEGIDVDIALDITDFVRSSIKEVLKTLAEATLLVVLVVFVFLHNVRATIVPILAIPVSIVGTFAGMYLFGFSVNLLTLFGLILSIGIVVDDAIVVIENVERNRVQLKLPPREAAIKAMQEVTGPVIAIVLVLCAVFVPVAFLGGISGQLYKQFALTIAISVVISGLMALTLSPAVAAILLKEHTQENRGVLRRLETAFDRATMAYVAGVRRVLRRPVIALAVFALLAAGTWWIFKVVPVAFFPVEDRGYILAVSYLPDGASLDRTQAVDGQARAVFAQSPAVRYVVEVDGFSLIDGQLKPNAGTMFINLKDYAQRTDPRLEAPAVIAGALPGLAAIREALVFAFNPPSIPGLGNIGGFEFWIQGRSEGDIGKLETVTQQFIQKAKIRPELLGLQSTIRATTPQIYLDVDREKAETLGVAINDVYDTLQILFGSLYVSQFTKYSRLYQVVVQAEADYRTKPEDIDQVYVRSRDGKMIPLKALVTLKNVPGPDLVSRFNSFPAARVLGAAAPGYSSGDAVKAVEELAAEALPAGYSYAWSGEAYELKKAGAASILAFVFGIVMVFLILAAQYERWSLPLGVVLTVPFALFGATLAIWWRGIANDIYFQIGLLTLIALAAKNAILIIEFAILKRKEGLSILEAAVEASRLRLRPIVMTSFAFILGCLPLAVAAGASSGSRRSIGTGVIGGMLGATLIAVFFIPLFFMLLEKLSEKFSRSGKPREETAASATAAHTEAD
jgi:multidrug efflux pump